MHSYTWFILLELTLAGGVIAFMGDRLGRFMGKRRMTLFGLRPRHTALFTTVVAGMLISVTSLAAVALLSQHVRTAIFEVDDIQRAKAHLGKELVRLQAQNRTLVSESKRLRTDYDLSKERAQRAAVEEKRSREKLQGTLQHLSRARAAAERRVAVLQREVVKRSRLAADKSAQIVRVSARIQRMQAELAGATVQLNEARARRDALATRYREAKVRLDDVSARHADVSNRLNAAQANLDATRKDLERISGEVRRLTDQVQASRQQIQGLQTAKAELETSRDGLQRQVDSLDEQRDQLAQAVQEAEARNKALRDSYVEQRLRAMALNLGWELAWEVVDGREPRARIRAHLESLVERARLVAVGRGAGPAGKPESALKVLRTVSSGEAREQQVLWDVEALDRVTEEISRANTGVVAQVRAATNTVAGEPVWAEIQLWQNRLVFHEGERIASKEMAGRKPTGQIVQDLVAMLQNEVGPAAVSRGMVPRGAVPGALQASAVGEVPLADLVGVAEQVRRMRGGALVEAVSPSDLWTADPMRVSFRVGPRPQEPPARRGGVLTAQ